LVVRVPIELKYQNVILSTSALANSGYESDENEIHVPISLAEKLGYDLSDLKGEEYSVVGTKVTTFILGRVKVRVVTSDKVTGWVDARAVTVLNEYEVILSDALIESLGIEIIKPKIGL